MAASRERLNQLLAIEAQEQETPRQRLARLQTIEQGSTTQATPSTPEPLPEGNIMDAIIEPIKSLVGSATGAAIGGLGGIVATPFVGSDGASDVVKDIQQDFASPPETQAGQESLQAIQDLIQAGVDVAAVPTAVLSGLIDMSIRGEPIEAIKTAIDVHSKGLVPLAQEATFNATDSALAATSVGVAPGFAGLLFPYVFGKKLPTKGRKIKLNQDGSPPPGISLKQATQIDKEGRKKEDAQFNQDSDFESEDLINEKRASDIAKKSPDKALAKYTLDKSGNLIDDHLAVEAMKQGIDGATVQSIKNMSRLDKVYARKMLVNLKRGRRNAEAGIENRHSDVIGSALKNKIIILRAKNNEAGKQLGVVAESLRGQSVDMTGPVSNFGLTLEKFGIKIPKDVNNRVIRDKKGQVMPDFTDSSLAPGDWGTIKEIVRQMNRLSKNGNPDALAAHEMKQIIRRNVKYGKGKEGGLSREVQDALKDFSRDIDGVLDTQFPRYDYVNTQYKDTIEAFNGLADIAGKKADLIGDTADRTLGVLTRRITSNAASGAPLGKAVKEVNRVILKYGGKVHDNINAQLTFSNMLNTRFKPETNTSFQADIGKEIQRVAGSSKTGILAEAAGSIANKIMGKTDEKAIKAIEALLKRP